jgi:hypothetical protein
MIADYVRREIRGAARRIENLAALGTALEDLDRLNGRGVKPTSIIDLAPAKLAEQERFPEPPSRM